MGPLEEASKGVVYRQEVLWDDVRAEGASWPTAASNARTGQGSGWQSGGGAVVEQSPDVPAVEGTHYARTWHNQTLFTTFNVVGGQPVTIRLHARAVRVGDLRDMKPIAGRATRLTWPPGGSSAEPTWATAWKPPRARTGASTTRPRPATSCAPKGSTTSGSRSAGTTTPVPAPSSSIRPEIFSPGRSTGQRRAA